MRVAVQDQSTSELDARVTRLVELHFHPRHGSRYWLQRAAELGIDALDEIQCSADLLKLGPMDETALAERPIEDFIPAALQHQRPHFLITETAGTLGRAKLAVHRRDEFLDAFVAPFIAAAERVNFPRGLNWLFIGPSGPHIIGKAATACASALGSADPFTIDLDPRWAKKLVPGSFAWKRYLEHIEHQALTLLATQKIGVLFSTPIVLESLIERMSAAQRERIHGLHLGGVSVSAAQRQRFEIQLPNTVILSGYGNSLFGVQPEVDFTPAHGFVYQAHGTRLIVRMIPLDGGQMVERLTQDVAYGDRGQVVMTRLDEAQLIVNLVERDSAVRTAPQPLLADAGFFNDAVGDPQPIVSQQLKPSVGFY